MRRPHPLLPTLLASVLVLGLGASDVSAQDVPPPGAMDGVPVGAEPDPAPDGAEPTPDPEAGTGADEPEAAVAPSAVSPSSTPPDRYFSREAYLDIEAAVAATPRSCSVTNNGLKALVLSPIFYESSGALTAASAPSPMTLSRYDEWNPSYPATTSNLGANQSLYAGRNPWTAYPRAYWHPGIGIWQYDSAGLGAPYTAVERMDPRVMAPAVAKRIVDRYCNALAAGQTGLQARKASWADWVGCGGSGCETVFQQLMQANFSQMRLLDGIARLGGTQLRTCSLPGKGTFTCAYVDPALAQGARWWAVNSANVPINDGDPTKPPAPLSTPFYVFSLDGREHRHWMSADSGYPVSWSASRLLGRNARYRTDQAGSGLAWSASSELCDLTAVKGTCVPMPPQGVTAAPFSVSGTYRPVSLDLNGDGNGDILWYGPGGAPDSLWVGQGGTSFTTVPISISGSYSHVIPGDFDGDGRDDILWYDRASGTSSLWRSTGNGSFVSVALAPGAGREPIALDVDNDGALEIFWYGPGAISDRLWDWQGAGFVSSPRSVNGSYIPIVGDFDGNGHDDIFWYSPGPGGDSLWLHHGAGAFTSRAVSVSGSYQPLVGDFDGDGRDDIFWYAPGPPGDSVWFGGPGASFTSRSMTVNGSFAPFVVDLLGDGRDDIVWYAPGPAADSWWRWSSTRTLSTSPLSLPQTQQPVVGAFSAGGADGVFWYGPGAMADVLWYR